LNLELQLEKVIEAVLVVGFGELELKWELALGAEAEARN